MCCRPAPCTPNEAGICLDVIKQADGTMPMLGVCLGHQAIGQVYGGSIVPRARADARQAQPRASHRHKSVFRGLNNDFLATRYHSLYARSAVHAGGVGRHRYTSEDGVIQGVMHESHPVHGVQFHPESIASENGHALLANFLAIARAISPRYRRETMKVTNTSVDFPAALALAQSGAPLGADETRRLFDAIFTGRLSEEEIIAYLSATADRKPTVEELVGAVTSMRQHMRAVAAPAGAMDLCGTGGDGLGTLNISTAVSFVVAACGVPVAKHGNRSASSRSGAACAGSLGHPYRP